MKFNSTSRRARFWRASLLFLLPLLLFAVIRERQSWQPRVLDKMPVVTALTWSPDGRFVAASAPTGFLNDQGMHALIEVYDVAARRSLGRWKAPESAQKMQFSPDGSTLYSLGFDNVLRGTSLPSGRAVPLPHLLINTGSWAFSPDGRYFAQRETAGLVVRELPSLAVRWILPLKPLDMGSPFKLRKEGVEGVISRFGPESSVVTAFSPDSRNLGAVLSPGFAGKPFHFVLWSLPPNRSAKAAQISRIKLPSNLPPSGQLFVFADQRHAALASPDFRLFDAQDKTAVRQWQGLPARSVAASPDGAIYARPDMGQGPITLFFPSNNTKRELRDGPSSFTNVLAFSPDSRLLAVANSDGSIVLWRVQ